MKRLPRLWLQSPNGLRSLQELPQRLGPASPLVFALLAAVVVHLLGFSYRQLRAQRQLQPSQPQLADDSPELLLFSRRQPLEESLQLAALAPLSSLPSLSNLPPPPLLSPRSASPAGRRQLAGRLQGGSIQASRQRVPRVGGTRRAHSTGFAPGFAGSALAVIRRLQGLGAAAESGGNPGLELPPDPDLQRPQGDAAAAWRQLWQRAVVVPPSAVGQISPTERLELRRLPLADAAQDGLRSGERMAVVLDDQLLLLWPDGQTLWIWRAFLPGNPEPASTKS